MKAKQIACLVAAGLIVALGSAATAEVIGSTFDSDADGWTTWGDTKNFGWKSDFGNPPGSIYAEDQNVGPAWGFEAPAKFLGNRSGAYGGSLSWDVYVSHGGQTARPHVNLEGAGTLLYWRHEIPPIGQWQSYSVTLTESTEGWSLLWGENVAPTKEEFQSVLADLTTLWIRTEFSTSADHAWLDNVVLTPEPATLSLLALAPFIALRRRRR